MAAKKKTTSKKASSNEVPSKDLTAETTALPTKPAVDKKTVISTLERIAVLLELSGANPFKARAFGSGARALQSYEGDLLEGLSSGELAKLKGVGKSLLGEIESLLIDGTSPAHDELAEQVPPGLLDMIKIPGLGPKKARVLYDELGIESVGELEYACNENRLVTLPGFGEKTQTNILKGIQYVQKFSGRHLLSDAWEAATAMLETVRSLPGVDRCELAGSIRRRKETIKDIDILVTSTDPGPIMDAFTSLPDVEDIIGHGETKSSVRLTTGIQVDLRVVEDSQFPFALAYFTGSKEHNTAMRSRAKERGLRLNEYGLYPVDEKGNKSETSLPCASEADIFDALDVLDVPPELREDRGEFDVDSIPELVRESHLQGVLHNHSQWSDGANTIEEMALAAKASGYSYLGMSDHSQSAFYAHGLKPDDVLRQHDEIDELNERLDGITVLKGIESDILPDGSLDYDEDMLARFDFVVASVHGHFGLDPVKQTERSIRAVQNPVTSVLGHPTGRLLLAREGFVLDMDAVLEAAAESGCAVELNANPHRLDLDWREIRKARRMGVMLSIGPDAHRAEGLADVRYGVAVGRKGWLTPAGVLNALGLDELRAYLAKRRQQG